VSRELTKKFAETVRGTIATVLDRFREREPKGEVVITVTGAQKTKKTNKKDVEE
jgi:16S rRNA (cytidine1402-2'-O)-methyltransferase